VASKKIAGADLHAEKDQQSRCESALTRRFRRFPQQRNRARGVHDRSEYA